MRYIEIASAIGAVVGVGALLKVIVGSKRKSRRTAVAMCGKVALVTGGTSGVGLETCERLICSGVRVFLACRDMERGKRIVKRLRKLAPPGYEEVCADYAYCDLADLLSVVTFARSFKEKGLPLNILVLNAGMVPKSSKNAVKVTTDGLEECFQTNHLSHFLLARLLTPSLKETPNSRVVVVSSSLHKGDKQGPPPLHVNSVQTLREQWRGQHGGMSLYKTSKLCNILFANELNKRLQAFGVTANALSPGFIPNTGLSRNQGLLARLFVTYVMPNLPFKFIATLDDAGDCVEYVTLSSQLDGVGGKYFSFCKEVPASATAMDEELGRKLWAVSEELVKGLHL